MARKKKNVKRRPTARQTEALNPWHPDREYMSVKEVPIFIKKLYGVDFNHNRVYDWIHRGNEINGRRYYLRAVAFGNKWVIKKADLIAYLKKGQSHL